MRTYLNDLLEKPLCGLQVAYLAVFSKSIHQNSVIRARPAGARKQVRDDAFEQRNILKIIKQKENKHPMLRAMKKVMVAQR